MTNRMRSARFAALRTSGSLKMHGSAVPSVWVRVTVAWRPSSRHVGRAGFKHRAKMRERDSPTAASGMEQPCGMHRR